MLYEVDKASWCQHVDGSDRLAVVFFYAPWCRNCKAVRPKLERIEREFKQDATFFQANFKKERELCYEQRVFTFPTVHFYLPGIGRVSRQILTAADADEKLRAALRRFLGGEPQQQLLRQISREALSPVVQYKELVGALQGLADMAAPRELEGVDFGQGVSAKKEGARLRSMVEQDEVRLAQVEELFRSLDADADGRLDLDELEAAVAALGPQPGPTASAVRERLRQDSGADRASVGVDLQTFVSLMIDKAVHEFAMGERALLPTFEALDADRDGFISQAELLTAIETFCSSMPQADGCDVEAWPLRLTEAFDAFATEEEVLDYARFVEMVGGREEATECAVAEEEVAAGPRVTLEEALGAVRTLDAGDGHVDLAALARHFTNLAAGEVEGAEGTPAGLVTSSEAYKKDEDEMMGERECFGENPDDLGCDAWFYGEDPSEKKEAREVDEAKIAKLRAAGEAHMARRRQVEAAAKALAEARLQQKLASTMPISLTATPGGDAGGDAGGNETD